MDNKRRRIVRTSETRDVEQSALELFETILQMKFSYLHIQRDGGIQDFLIQSKKTIHIKDIGEFSGLRIGFSEKDGFYRVNLLTKQSKTVTHEVKDLYAIIKLFSHYCFK
jgi:hypothetical protein